MVYTYALGAYAARRAGSSPVSGTKESEYNQAFQDYGRLEQQNASSRQTVLVAVNQIKKLREAYPNYFMSLSTFLDIITFILAKIVKRSKI